MKLLFYINSLQYGGAERVISNLATQFSNDNEVVLATSFISEKEYVIGEKVKRVVFADRHIDGLIKRNLFLIKKLKALIKEEKPDVCISFMAEPNFRLLLVGNKRKIKKIISVRNDPNREYPNKIFKFLARTLFKKANAVVFQTEDAKKWFSKKIQDTSTIIFNQVDEKFFNVGLPKDKSGIYAVGRLTSQKNHMMLIDAYSKIAEKIEDNLYIYGEGELREELQTHINEKGLKKRVFLCGTTNDIPNAIKGAKLFVLSSDYEGMPNTLMEAMAMGIPCISTDCPCGGPKMLINNGENGFLTKVGDSDDLACKMLNVLNMSEKDRNLIGEKAKEKAAEFLPEKIYLEWGECFANVAQNRGVKDE